MSSTSINSFSGLSVPFLINNCQLGEYIGSRLGSGFHLPTWIGNTGPNGGWDGIDCFKERTPSFWYLFPFYLLPLRPTLHPTVHLSSPASPPIGLLEYMLSFLLRPLFLHPSPGLRLDVTPWDPFLCGSSPRLGREVLGMGSCIPCLICTPPCLAQSRGKGSVTLHGRKELVVFQELVILSWDFPALLSAAHR